MFYLFLGFYTNQINWYNIFYYAHFIVRVFIIVINAREFMYKLK